MTDIVERLRSRAKYDGWSTEDVLSEESADTIEALRAENARLREALKPFADRATAVEAQYKDCYPPRASMVGIEFKYLRAARAALGEDK